ncbi:hypothetical protein Tco_0390916 [Tanacetum coccineum]
MWIKGCLNSAYASVLINGSPTKEFKIHKGLRQGDPLSPFLFILAVKALHVTFLEAKAKDIFKGVKVGNDNIFGVGAAVGDTNLLASILCCQPSSLPFTYLGLPIGANMNRSCNWKPIIDKFHNRLSSWKARSLSFGGRLTHLKFVLRALGTYYFSLFKAPKCVISYLEKLRRNFFWGGSVDNKKLAWVAWKQVCSSKYCGRLGIGSLLTSNLAMLTKWWWWFKSESNSLWHQVTTSIFGSHGHLETNILTPIPHSHVSPWKEIYDLNKDLLKNVRFGNSQRLLDFEKMVSVALFDLAFSCLGVG